MWDDGATEHDGLVDGIAVKYTSRAGLHTNTGAEGIGHFKLGGGGHRKPEEKDIS